LTIDKNLIDNKFNNEDKIIKTNNIKDELNNVDNLSNQKILDRKENSQKIDESVQQQNSFKDRMNKFLINKIENNLDNLDKKIVDN